ncbi:Inner membrane ABC transporter permease protein ydcV [Sebaldella termitidis]|uniref:Binding-protein-dependent transport systems inner membrane component n=1 Tax=Sebaldella termitidis (strain ATCC 33386 / NCTC 11300) TaxID=526218 RepID=D1AFV2_SEBTE|nr:ABC transporter permease [Sebaldella termitidis]ACZ07987.1 binding-protein-dependent transport systems inner membrane component [Sebaldella termitidis ATCC 33386]MBP7979974.1 ABC transporter permease [Sebaldella sp.]SUI23288.1 Inner membrane ABC transporter permease protein ydcV [Sebaldella termitidis]
MDDKRRISLFFFILVLIFFYLPIIMLVVLSFNNSRGFSWGGFSLKWYIELFRNSPDLWEAVLRSILIALGSSFLSVVIATLGAIAIKWYNFKVKKYVKFISYIPLVIPDIIMGISLAIFFANIVKGGVPLSMWTIFIAHTTFNIPFALFIIMSRLDEFDYSVVEAAYDLGASEFTTLVKVIIPMMMPGIIAGFLMAVTLSFDDFVITSFVSGNGQPTLPIYIYASIKRGVSPVVNALSVILIIGTIILTFSSRKLQKNLLG